MVGPQDPAPGPPRPLFEGMTSAVRPACAVGGGQSAPGGQAVGVVGAQESLHVSHDPLFGGGGSRADS